MYFDIDSDDGKLIRFWVNQLPCKSSEVKFDCNFSLSASRVVNEPINFGFEYAIYGGEGRMYAMLGCSFAPSESEKFTIHYSNENNPKDYQSSISKQLVSFFPRGPYSNSTFRYPRENWAMRA